MHANINIDIEDINHSTFQQIWYCWIFKQLPFYSEGTYIFKSHLAIWCYLQPCKIIFPMPNFMQIFTFYKIGHLRKWTAALSVIEFLLFASQKQNFRQTIRNIPFVSHSFLHLACFPRRHTTYFNQIIILYGIQTLEIMRRTL